MPIEKYKTSKTASDVSEELKEKIKHMAEPAFDESDISAELEELDSDRERSGDAAQPDTSFELHGIEDEEPLEEQENAEEDREEEHVRTAVNMIESFNDRPEIDSEKDAGLTELQTVVDEYVDMTGREAMVDKEFSSIDNSAVERAADKLSEVGKACDDYLEEARPFFRPGRKRKAAVNRLREEVEGLKDDREGLKKCYEDSYLTANGLRSDDETSGKGMGDDDGTGKKKRNNDEAVVMDEKQKAFVRGAGIIDASVLPVEFTEEGDIRQADLSGFKNAAGLSADKKADEVKLSETARMQIYMVKAIGLIFGVSDWQQITDPEGLLYREEGDSVEAVKINIVPGVRNKLSSVVTEEEGRRLADSFKGDTHLIKLISAILAERSQLIRELEVATGISHKVLNARMRSIRRYLAEAARGERGKS